MKYLKLGALAAFSSMAIVACSSSQREQGEGTASVGYSLVSNGVQILSAEYDLNTQAGADVVNGSIPVPNDNSVINGNIGQLAAGSYSLVFTATGLYNDAQIPCVSEAELFSLADGENLALNDIALVCTASLPGNGGSVSFNVSVELQEVVQNIIETFVVAPTTAGFDVVDGACDWGPIAIDINNDPTSGVTYAWSASPDGSFSFSDATNTTGTYECGSPGTKTLTLTATLGGESATANVDVTCLGSTAECQGPVCGDGNQDPGEECDVAAPYCQNCQIEAVCGDGIEHAPEECDDGNLNAGDGCSPTCTDEPTVDLCQECINAIPNVGDFNTGVCDADPACVAVRTCALDEVDATVGSCYTPTPAECYCGIDADLDACENDNFFESNPLGPCTDVMLAGFPAGTTNAQALEMFYSFDHPAGQAMAIVEEARVACAAECGL